MTKPHMKRVMQSAATFMRWGLLPFVFVTDAFAPVMLLLILLVIYQLETWFQSGTE